jgi:hypothetical protein
MSAFRMGDVEFESPHPAAASPPRSCPQAGGHRRTGLTLRPSGAVAARHEHRRSRRPCHPRATSSGHERYPAVNHGHCHRGRCAARRPLTCGGKATRNCMACKGSRLGSALPCPAGRSVPGRGGPERRRRPRPDGTGPSVLAESVTHWDHRGTSGHQRSAAAKRNRRSKSLQLRQLAQRQRPDQIVVPKVGSNPQVLHRVGS